MTNAAGDGFTRIDPGWRRRPGRTRAIGHVHPAGRETYAWRPRFEESVRPRQRA